MKYLHLFFVAAICYTLFFDQGARKQTGVAYLFLFWGAAVVTVENLQK